MKKTLQFLFLLFPFYGFSQIEDLTQDLDFFQDRQALYQKWLDHSGLGQVLKVEDIKVKPEELSLYLAFQTEDVDSSMIAWKALKQTYEADFPITLEQQLFYKMVSLMEVRQSIANIQIYDTYDLKVEPLFFVGIYFNEGKVQVESSGHKSIPRNIDIRVDNLSKKLQLSEGEVRERFTKEYVFNTIYDYAVKRFEGEQCGNRQPRVQKLEEQEQLRFEVSNLCREVLENAPQPKLCRVLNRFNYGCNWIKKEKLEFTISFIETRNGFNISVLLDGKYGSGYYDQVQRGGYQSMEIDFDEEIQKYADLYTQALIDLLTKR
ncbi:MAG: hypothetical protein AAGI23_08080 [Bacteroidota bacterium]